MMRWILLILGIAGAVSGFQPSPACGALGIRIESRNLLPTEVATPEGTGYWGQAFRLEARGGSAFNRFEWRIAGPALLDFDERVSSLLRPGTGWRVERVTSPLPAAIVDRVYFVPGAPGATEARNIHLRARLATNGSWCESEATVRLRPHAAPVELYTADHRDARERRFEKGRVIDEHYPWHFFHHFEQVRLNAHPSFLHWHHLYVSRYQEWRRQFGYPPLTPWRPGLDAIPTGQLFVRNAQFPVIASFAKWPGGIGGATFAEFEDSVVLYHDDVHNRLQRCTGLPFGCFQALSSPKSELFWRFHLALDREYRRFCTERPAQCPDTGEK
jgi:hypothetical protein